MSVLADHIRANTARLASRLYDEMYRDPFWDARYGARGRTHSRQDAEHHLGYLAESLDADDPEVFVRYAAWLRTVLVSRGMSTAHLAESFDLLAGYLAEEAWPGVTAACTLLRRASHSLCYAEGPARDLFEAARVQDRETRTLLSYLADAVAADRPQIFTAYARWAAVTGLLSHPLDETLAMLAEKMAGLRPEAAAVAQPILAEAAGQGSG